MKNNLNNSQYLIVLGTTFSGSGAVFDYLNGRGDLYEPLFGQEYLLPILPNGLMTLEAVSDKAFDPATTEHALIQFEDIANKLMNYWARREDVRLNKKLPLFKDAIEEFIDDISLADFPMRLLWRELKQSPTQRILNKIKNRLGFKKEDPQTRLLVSQKDLVIAAQKMHNKMFQLSAEGRPILLDQGGSGWNPIESTKYFSNCKVVLVTRDPRDQFVEIKHYKKATSLKGFIDWYKEMQRRLKLINNSNILFIRFEDFVKKNNFFLNTLCDHISLSSSISSDYQPDLSKKNIGKFHQLLDKNELQIIESHLGEYIFPE
jgi:hypothetical protein